MEAKEPSEGSGKAPGELSELLSSVTDLASLLKIAWNWEGRSFPSGALENATLEELFEAAALDDRLSFLALMDLESLPPAAQKAISDDLKKWSQLTRDKGTAGAEPVGLRILAFVSPLFQLPKEDMLLGVHYWWAQTDSVDSQLIFRQLAEEARLDESALTRYWWVKALCQGFCHDDFVLMGLIFDHLPTSIEGLIGTLAAHPLAEAAKEFQEQVAAQPAQMPLRLGEKPALPSSALYQKLWAEGLLLVRPESMLHPLLMEPEALVKTIGAGQRQVILPLVDYMQSFLVAALEAFFDPLVFDRYEEDEEERANILTEIGHLAFFISYKLPINALFDDYVKHKAITFAHPWRIIRNTVAHNKMVSYAELNDAFENYRVFYDLVRHKGVWEAA
ncbi:MAG: hypothetical protein LBE49_01730 [Deltaproteobacteria bacterium]|nr:hypothetical protein [Deltaproteobacteria bacterium]